MTNPRYTSPETSRRLMAAGVPSDSSVFWFIANQEDKPILCEGAFLWACYVEPTDPRLCYAYDLHDLMTWLPRG